LPVYQSVAGTSHARCSIAESLVTKRVQNYASSGEKRLLQKADTISTDTERRAGLSATAEHFWWYQSYAKKLTTEICLCASTRCILLHELTDLLMSNNDLLTY